MNLNYQSRFMGYDIYKTPMENRRIFISTYQDMGYVKNDTLVILSPQQKIESFKVDFTNGAAIKIAGSEKLTSEAIAWYQEASWLFKNGGYSYLQK